MMNPNTNSGTRIFLQWLLFYSSVTLISRHTLWHLNSSKLYALLTERQTNVTFMQSFCYCYQITCITAGNVEKVFLRLVYFFL